MIATAHEEEQPAQRKRRSRREVMKNMNKKRRTRRQTLTLLWPTRRDITRRDEAKTRARKVTRASQAYFCSSQVKKKKERLQKKKHARDAL